MFRLIGKVPEEMAMALNYCRSLRSEGAWRNLVVQVWESVTASVNIVSSKRSAAGHSDVSAITMSILYSARYRDSVATGRGINT